MFGSNSSISPDEISSSPPSSFEGLGSKSDFRSPVEVALFNNRERMRDAFMNLMRKFTERRAKHTGLGGSGVVSSTEMLRPLIIEFMAGALPSNLLWFSLDVFVAQLLQKCWSGVDAEGMDARAARGKADTMSASMESTSHKGTKPSHHANSSSISLTSSVTPLDSKAYAHMAQLKARIDAPAASSLISMSGERKTSVGGGGALSSHSSAAPSPMARSQPQASSQSQPRGLQTPTSRAVVTQSSWNTTRVVSAATMLYISPTGFPSHIQSPPPASSPPALPPHLSFSFQSTSSSPAPLAVLFPELQEFFAFFVMECNSPSLVAQLKQAMLLKVHQLCDVSNRNAAGAGSSTLSLSFSHQSAESLKRTWHGRILKLKLLAKFLSLISCLPQADLSRMAEAGGAAMQIDGEIMWAPSAAIGQVVRASTTAMDRLSFPPFLELQRQATTFAAAPNSAAALLLAPFVSSAALVPVFTFPLHLYLRFAFVTHSLSLFVPWLCAYLRVLRVDRVQLEMQYHQQLLQELAHLCVHIKQRLREAAQQEQQRRVQEQAMANKSLDRTFSSPVHPSTRRSTQHPASGGSQLSPVLTPLTTPAHSPYPSPPVSGSNRSDAEVDADAPTPPLSPRSMARNGMLAPASGSLAAHPLMLPAASLGSTSSPAATSTLHASPAASLLGLSPNLGPPTAASASTPTTASPFSSVFLTASPSTIAVNHSSSSSSSAAARSFHAPHLFLLFELQALFEGLEIDVDEYSEAFLRTNPTQAAANMAALQAPLCVQPRAVTPPSLATAGPASSSAGPSSSSQAEPARPAPTVRRGLMHQLNSAARGGLAAESSHGPAAAPVRSASMTETQLESTVTPPNPPGLHSSSVASVSVSSFSGSSYATLDSIPSLVSVAVIPSLVGKTLEQIKSSLRRESMLPEPAFAATAEHEAAASSQDGTVPPSTTLLRTVSAVNRERRKITPTQENSTPNLRSTAPAASQSAAPAAASPIVPFDLLRPAFIQQNPELSALLPSISTPLEQHVRDGHGVMETLQPLLDAAIERHTPRWIELMRDAEQQQDAANIKTMVAALTAEVVPLALAACTASCLTYLQSRTLAALRALASPTLPARVLHTASLLAAKHSLGKLRDNIHQRIRKTVEEKGRAVVKKIKTAAGRAGSSSACAQPSDPSATAAPTATSAAVASLASTSVVNTEIAIRAAHLRSLLPKLLERMHESCASVAICSTLLRSLLPLAICVTASQSSPVLQRYTSFAPLRDPTDLIAASTDLLQRIDPRLGVGCESPALLTPWQQCKQQLEIIRAATEKLS